METLKKRKFWHIKSFATRLSIWVIVPVSVLLLITAVIVNVIVRQGILREEKLRAESALANAEENINKVLIAVETAVRNHASEIRQNVSAPHEEMYRITREMLEMNPMIMGAAIAFEPNYYPDQGRYFSPYSYRGVNGELRSKQLGTGTYDYPSMDWFLQPKELKRDIWSEPYCDVGGGEITMITYSYPLADDQGNVYAVITADVSLDWLSAMTDSLRYYKQSYCFILSRDGTYLAHPIDVTVRNETVFAAAEKLHNAGLAKIGRAMVEGKADVRRFNSPHLGSSFIFFKPIARTGWSMAIVCSADDFFSRAMDAGFFVATFILVMLVLLTLILRAGVQRFSRPLTQFTEAVNEVALGNLHVTLPPVQTEDEMLRLHNAFNAMQQSLEQQMEELKEANAQRGSIERELSIASNIQQAMLPKMFPPYPDRDDIDIYGLQTPAKAVGGDLFDFYIRDEKLFFCIGDVSGKGIPASLVMAVARALFRTLSIREPRPDRIISQMNGRLIEDNEMNMFVTFFIGVLDLPTGRLRYCNAGHNPPLLVAGQGDAAVKTFLPCDSNVPIGVMGGWRFTMQETDIAPGTILFLYTDGLTEAENTACELFGEERLCQAMAAEPTSKATTERMAAAVHAFTGEAEQSDDLTMLTLRYTRPDQGLLFQREITLANDVSQVDRLTDFVSAVCEAVGTDVATTMQMTLAMEEAVVNVMNYAYPEGTVGDIRIAAAANAKTLRFTITDSGIPFDPTTRQEADTTLSAEERPIGGLGIHLVTQLMDSINYERKDGMNVLTLRKKL